VRFASPETYTPKHLAERILLSKTALEGERKHVTVLFADLKGSMELLADRDPEEARTILDPVLAELLRGYFDIDERDDARAVRAKVTGTLLTLDRVLEDAVPAMLWILDVAEPGEAFLALEPPQRRRRALESVKRMLLRESRVQPLRGQGAARRAEVEVDGRPA